MRVPIAYLAVVLIWSTTPLGIVWSSETVHPTMAVLLRMLIAWFIGWGIIVVSRINVPWHNNACKLYLFSALGIFGGMSLSYAAAAYLSSGLMSLIFGLSPILSGFLAHKLLAEDKFNNIKKFALIAALIGLVIVCYDKMTLKEDAYIGIVFVLIAVFFFSLSGVMVKTVQIKINPVATTVGALTFSTPMFFIMWLLLDGNLGHESWSFKSISAIVYLGLFGSLIGFISYFYVLQKLSASTVALVTMITPVLAIAIGALLNNEVITDNLIIGACFVVFGLTCYQWSSKVEYVVRYRFRKINDTQT